MITVEEFKKYMKLPDSIPEDETEFIMQCIRASVDEMNVYTNRRLVQLESDLSISLTEATEYFDGYGTNILYVNNHPIINFGTGTNEMMYLENNTDWKDILEPPDTIANSVLVLAFGKLVLQKGYVFPAGIKNIKVKYKSGYTSETVPGDLKRICYELSAEKFLNSMYAGDSRLNIEYRDDSTGKKTKYRRWGYEVVLGRYRRRSL